MMFTDRLDEIERMLERLRKNALMTDADDAIVDVLDCIVEVLRDLADEA